MYLCVDKLVAYRDALEEISDMYPEDLYSLLILYKPITDGEKTLAEYLEDGIVIQIVPEQLDNLIEFYWDRMYYCKRLLHKRHQIATADLSWMYDDPGYLEQQQQCNEAMIDEIKNTVYNYKTKEELDYVSDSDW